MAKLWFKYSAMNAGKTTNLLQQNHNFCSIGQNVMILKSALDTRDTKIVSRLGVDAECIIVPPETDLLDLYDQEEPQVILVDEAQFLTEKQVLELREIVDKYDISVFCFGLRTDFKGKLFEGSKALFECADAFEELKVQCYCQKHKAIMVAKFDSTGTIIRDGESVDCGGEEKYVSLCHKCWSKKKIPAKLIKSLNSSR